MQTRLHKSPYGYYKYTIRDFNDLISDTDPDFKGNKRFRNYRELLKGINRRGHEDNKRIVKRICRLFLEHLMDDLIYKNYRFQLPIEDFGTIYVGYRTYKNSYFRYNIQTGGYNYTPRLDLTMNGRKMCDMSVYYIKFNTFLYRNIMLEVAKGHKYSNI